MLDANEDRFPSKLNVGSVWYSWRYDLTAWIVVRLIVSWRLNCNVAVGWRSVYLNSSGCLKWIIGDSAVKESDVLLVDEEGMTAVVGG